MKMAANPKLIMTSINAVALWDSLKFDTDDNSYCKVIYYLEIDFWEFLIKIYVYINIQLDFFLFEFYYT